MMATDLQKRIDRINSLRQEGRLSPSQAKALRQQARSTAGGNDTLGPAGRQTIDQAIRQTARPSQQGGVTQPTPGGGEEEEVAKPKPRPDAEAPEGYEWQQDADGNWNLVKVGETAEERAERERQEREEELGVERRETARASLESLLRQYGLESLFPTLNDLLSEFGGNETIIMSRLRETEAYRERFKGIQMRLDNGYSAINEATYLALENDYKKIMRSYGLSDTYYGSDRLSELIGGDVSELELDSRISVGQRMLESSNQEVLRELQEYYPEISNGDLLSYLLDPKQGQEVLTKKIRSAQIGGAAEAAGFEFDRARAEGIGATALGQTLDPFDARTQAQLQSTFAQAGRTARRETTLAGIDREAYDPFEAVEAAFGDEDKRLASERRGRRERARFSGTAGAARSALSQSRNF